MKTLPTKTGFWKRNLDRARKTYANTRPFNLAACYRGMVYADAPAETPDTLVRAAAFKNFLQQARPVIRRSEMFVGSLDSFYADRLPQGLSPEKYTAAIAAGHKRGTRDFWAGSSHTLPHYEKLLKIGIAGYKKKIALSRKKNRTRAQRDFLKSAAITLDALSSFILQHATAAQAAGLPGFIVSGLRAVARRPPRTLYQAMQLVWITHLVYSAEGRYAQALGRMDQYLYPFYKNDIRSGILMEDIARELFCHFWVRIEEQHEITNICIGGTTPRGADATNELSYIILDATRLVRSPHANISARLHAGSPEKFHRACLEVIRTGVGFPAIFNEKVTLQGLELLGVPGSVARTYCMVGCIETMLPGLQPAWSDSRYNLLLCLQQTMNAFGPTAPRSFSELMTAYKKRLRQTVKSHVRTISDHIRKYPATRFADPFLSVLTDDCIGRAKDINDGGARFPRFHGVAGMGVATTADALAAVKKLVLAEKRVSWQEMATALKDNFKGYEPLRQLLLNHAPKYGNHEPYVDTIAADLVDIFSQACLENRLPDGGRAIGLMAANVTNIPAGKEVGASADGRFAGEPLSDAASPHFGRDMHGPTAFLGSVNTPDYTHAMGGNVINMKFDPEHFKGTDGLDRLQVFSRYFVKSRIPQLQFNFTGNRELLAAQRDPEKYRNLVVRVSGFSAYFVTLDPEVQHDVIRRRAHGC